MSEIPCDMCSCPEDDCVPYMLCTACQAHLKCKAIASVIAIACAAHAIDAADANAIVADAPPGTAILRLEDWHAIITARAALGVEP